MRQEKTAATGFFRQMLTRTALASVTQPKVEGMSSGSSGWLKLKGRRGRFVLIATLVIVGAGVAAAAAAFVSIKGDAGRLRAKSSSGVAAPVARPLLVASENDHIHAGRLQPRLRDALQVLGDRLERHGKERVILTGTLTHTVASREVTAPVELISELPHKLRLVEQAGNQTHIRGFDGAQAWKHGGTLDRSEQDLIHSLVYDTPDHFFLGQMNGSALRLMGVRFRLDDGAETNYSGPYYDIYQLADADIADPSIHAANKHYYFNSATLLLERVRYELERDGGTVRVEVLFNHWQQVNSQQIPGFISRSENGQPVFEFQVNSVKVGGRVADGSFSQQ